MKLIAGFVSGFIFAATIYWSPQIANRILTMNPPETYAGYPGPKCRNWKKGVEQ